MRRTIVNNLLIEFKEKSPGKFNFTKRDSYGFAKFSIDLLFNEVEDGFGTKAMQDVQAYINSIDHLKQICVDYGWMEEQPDQTSQEEFDEVMEHPLSCWNMVRDGWDSMSCPTIEIWKNSEDVVTWQYFPKGKSLPSTHNGDNSLSLYDFMNHYGRMVA